MMEVQGWNKKETTEEVSQLQMTGEIVKNKYAKQNAQYSVCLLFTLTCAYRIWQDTKKQKESMFHLFVNNREKETCGRSQMQKSTAQVFVEKWVKTLSCSPFL